MRDFEKLWRECVPSIRQLAQRLARGRENAEDLVSDTVLRALQRFDSYEDGTSFDNWVKRIMVNVWRNTRRARKRSVRTIPIHILDPDDVEELMIDQTTPPALCLESALAILQPPDVLLLTALAKGELSTDAATGTDSPGLVRIRLFRARTRLRRATEA